MEAAAILRLLRKIDWPKPKLVAFACWCVRHTPLADGRKAWDLLDDQRSRRAVEVAESWLAGLTHLERVESAHAAASFAYDQGVYASDPRVIAARAAASAAYVAHADRDAGAAAAEYSAFALAGLAGALAASSRASFEAAYDAAVRCHADYLLQDKQFARAARHLNGDPQADNPSWNRPQPAPRASGEANEAAQAGHNRIRVRGLNGGIEGMVWETSALLRAGRLAELEMVLDDTSVSRRHAEVRRTSHGWCVRDLGSTNGTYLNGRRIGSEQWPLRPHDVLQFGHVALRVEFDTGDNALEHTVGNRDQHARPEWVQVLATVNSWANTRAGEPSRGQVPLSLRLGGENPDESKGWSNLHAILDDAIKTLAIDCGSLLLADDPDGVLKLRAINRGNGQVLQDDFYSRSLAQWCFSSGRSVLAWWYTVLAGLNIYQVNPVLCVVLRTAERVLGVLFLVRAPLQQPFTEDDLHAADAFADLVSADIEKYHLCVRPVSRKPVQVASVEQPEDVPKFEVKEIEEAKPVPKSTRMTRIGSIGSGPSIKRVESPKEPQDEQTAIAAASELAAVAHGAFMLGIMAIFIGWLLPIPSLLGMLESFSALRLARKANLGVPWKAVVGAVLSILSAGSFAALFYSLGK